MKQGSFKGAKWKDDWMYGIKEANGREVRRWRKRKEGRKDVNTSVFYVAPVTLNTCK